uniref:Uncharacterized protein n=1 Tax=Siphoviridae sp. ctnMb19 TaxID=2825659 RepID=A0A8S5NUT0_9CAUD|nr:MAG TPA: hypothetical protein [Siphoviridae sp. ctnMb19]
MILKNNASLNSSIGYDAYNRSWQSLDVILPVQLGSKKVASLAVYPYR